MAYDLLFGKTARDWSCGSLLSLPTRQQVALEVVAKNDVEKLDPLVRQEVQANFNTILRLDAAQRLPVVERKAFGTFMKKWIAFGTEKNGKFGAEDVVALRNFREANKRFTERLGVFDQMAKTPLKEPVKPLTVQVEQFHPPGWQLQPNPRPWGLLVSIGLGLAGLGYFAGTHR